MSKVYSKYKIIGDFGLLLFIEILIFFGTAIILTFSEISLDKVDLLNDQNTLYAYVFLIGINLLFWIFLSTQCTYIIMDSNGITFINPLIPFLRSTKQWTYFDYHILVQEASRYDTYEAVWLIKDEKVKVRFSSFYYKNYIELKYSLKTKGLGKKEYNRFEQLLLLFGMKKIKNEYEKV
jgi:hypothetical protein